MRYFLVSKIALIIILFFTSCVPMVQVLETESSDVKYVRNEYFYENSDLKVSYNLWEQGGKVSFYVFNKSDNPIFIDWDKSHFIYNGTSYEYWFDSENTKSFYTFSNHTAFYDAMSISNKKGITQTSTIKPKKIIHLPPKSGILVSKYIISSEPYYTCDFNLKPIIKTGDVIARKFTTITSPIKFRNYISYSFNENSSEKKIIDNDFFLSTVYNMNIKTFNGDTLKIKSCNYLGVESSISDFVYPYKKDNSFYIFVKKK